LRQYQFSNGQFNTTPYALSTTVGGGGQPGGILSLSANGTNAGSGIVWASLNTSSDANQAVVAGTLHAYNAQDISQELWNSDMVPARDAIGNFAKFVAPTIANGKVYMATFSNRLNVYGLLPQPYLSGRLSGANVVLSWPTNAYQSFKLQTSPSIGTNASWTNTTFSVVITNGMQQVTVPASNRAAFYRLKL
jgi:hypothetical protein